MQDPSGSDKTCWAGFDTFVILVEPMASELKGSTVPPVHLNKER